MPEPPFTGELQDRSEIIYASACLRFEINQAASSAPVHANPAAVTLAARKASIKASLIASLVATIASALASWGTRVLPRFTAPFIKTVFAASVKSTLSLRDSSDLANAIITRPPSMGVASTLAKRAVVLLIPEAKPA